MVDRAIPYRAVCPTCGYQGQPKILPAARAEARAHSIDNPGHSPRYKEVDDQ